MSETSLSGDSLPRRKRVSRLQRAILSCLTLKQGGGPIGRCELRWIVYWDYRGPKAANTMPRSFMVSFARSIRQLEQQQQLVRTSIKPIWASTGITAADTKRSSLPCGGVRRPRTHDYVDDRLCFGHRNWTRIQRFLSLFKAGAARLATVRDEVGDGYTSPALVVTYTVLVHRLKSRCRYRRCRPWASILGRPAIELISSVPTTVTKFLIYRFHQRLRYPWPAKSRYRFRTAPYVPLENMTNAQRVRLRRTLEVGSRVWTRPRPGDE